MTFFVLQGVHELGSAVSKTPLPQPGAEALVPLLLCFLGVLNPLLCTKELESRSSPAEAGSPWRASFHHSQTWATGWQQSNSISDSNKMSEAASLRGGFSLLLLFGDELSFLQ